MLAAALAFQHIGGLDPCVLCIYQRWPHVAAIAVGLIGLALARTPRAAASALAVVAVALLVSAGIGVYHVGVEQGWIAASAACTGSASDTAGSIEALRQQILNASTARCDEPAWIFLGISMAGWNVLLSSALAALALVGALRVVRNQRGESR